MNSPTSKQFIKLTFQCYFALMALALLNPDLAADVLGQNLDSYRVDLSVKEASVVDIIKHIEEQTNFRFVYDRKVGRLENTFDIAYTNVSLRSVLELMAKDANLSFRRINRTISIDVRPRSAPKLVEEVVYQTITGTITDEAGIPLAGASIIEKGSMNGTTTDFDGNFSLDVDSDATLVISYIGYKTQEVAVNGQARIDVQLDPD